MIRMATYEPRICSYDTHDGSMRFNIDRKNTKYQDENDTAPIANATPRKRWMTCFAPNSFLRNEIWIMRGATYACIRTPLIVSTTTTTVLLKNAGDMLYMGIFER